MAENVGVGRDPITTIVSAGRSAQMNMTTGKKTYSSHQWLIVSFLFSTTIIVAFDYAFPSISICERALAREASDISGWSTRS